LPFQGTINGRLGKSIESPAYASFISFVIGTVALLIFSVVTQPSLKWNSLRTAHPFEWAGGLLGAFYVLVVVLMLPRLGAALTFSLIVAGQIVISVWLDHIGFLGAVPHSINLPRILGVLLIIGGVILVRKF
jgi:transporter family-2 protein